MMVLSKFDVLEETHFLSYYYIYLLGLAVSPNDHTVIILKKSGSKWEKEAVLEEVSLLDVGHFILVFSNGHYFYDISLKSV